MYDIIIRRPRVNKESPPARHSNIDFVLGVSWFANSAREYRSTTTKRTLGDYHHAQLRTIPPLSVNPHRHFQPTGAVGRTLDLDNIQIRAVMSPRASEPDARSYTYDETEQVAYYVTDAVCGAEGFSPYDTDSDTASLSSHHSASTLSSQEARAYFQEVGGRLYPTDPAIPIFLPQDEQENRRLDHEHIALKLVMGRNYVGPVASHLRYEPNAPRKRVLDIGTQQGTWVQEMASEFPHVDFVSLDFSPMAAHIPRENITFEVYDLYAGLAEADASFDMVHIRHTANKVGNYSFLIQELHRVLRPGGLLISGEFENETYSADNPSVPLGDASPRLTRALKLVRQALAAQSVMVDAGRQLPGMLNDSSLFAHTPSSACPGFSSESDIDTLGTSYSSNNIPSDPQQFSTSHPPN
ncbi:hypothetical protein OPQ81_007966 [Rhizoctonia solani]|nr:hypothetical protein OPQ81_007966 [Rhizoctonia solani]